MLAAALTVLPLPSPANRPVIQVYQFAPAFGLPNASPFCMKLETYLRMCALPFELINNADVFKAPKGKLPYIDDEGTVVTDTSFIVEHLKQRYGDPLDTALTPLQRACATAFQRLFEEDLYWALLHMRWVRPEGWALTREAFFGTMAAPMRWFVPALARRGLRQQLRGHGMGRHTATEIDAIGCRDLTAVADFLGDKPFLLGDKASSIDATAYAFLANVLWTPLDAPLVRHARERPTLERYCLRMKARYFD